MQGAVYDNDRDIAHVESIRLRQFGSDGYYRIRVAGTALADVDDVISPFADQTWLASQPIDLGP
jgi:hypothetical protein